MESLKTAKATYIALKEKEGTALEQELLQIAESSKKRAINGAKDLGTVFVFDKVLKDSVTDICGSGIGDALNLIRKASIVTSAVTVGISVTNWLVAKGKLADIEAQKMIIRQCIKKLEAKGLDVESFKKALEGTD